MTCYKDTRAITITHLFEWSGGHLKRQTRLSHEPSTQTRQAPPVRYRFHEQQRDWSQRENHVHRRKRTAYVCSNSARYARHPLQQTGAIGACSIGGGGADAHRLRIFHGGKPDHCVAMKFVASTTASMKKRESMVGDHILFQSDAERSMIPRTPARDRMPANPAPPQESDGQFNLGGAYLFQRPAHPPAR